MADKSASRHPLPIEIIIQPKRYTYTRLSAKAQNGIVVKTFHNLPSSHLFVAFSRRSRDLGNIQSATIVDSMSPKSVRCFVVSMFQ